MIVDKRNAKEEELYTAYGYTVNGTKAIYRWTYDGSGREEDCLIAMRILNEDGAEIYSYSSYNNPVFMVCFNRNVDNFLWWLLNDKPDNYDIKEQFYSMFVKNSSIFSYKIEQRKREEKQKENFEHERIERERKYKNMEEELFNYCKSKRLNLYKGWRCFYIIDFLDKKIKGYFDRADEKRIEEGVEYVTKKGIKSIKIIYKEDITEIEKVFNDVKNLKTKRGK